MRLIVASTVLLSALTISVGALAQSAPDAVIAGGRETIGHERWCVQSQEDNTRCVYQTEDQCKLYVLPDQGRCVENAPDAAEIAPHTESSIANAPLGHQEWCIDLKGAAPRCAYASIEECNKFVLPQQGTCIRNPNAEHLNPPKATATESGSNSPRATTGSSAPP